MATKTPPRRSVRIIPARADVVAVGVVAAAAAVVGPRRSAHCRRTDPVTVAVASTTHGDSATTGSANRDRAAPCSANPDRAAPGSHACAAAGGRVLRRVGDQQHGCGCQSDENPTQHWRSPSFERGTPRTPAHRTEPRVSPKPCVRELRGLDLDQTILTFIYLNDLPFHWRGSSSF